MLSFNAPLLMRNRHFQTIFASHLRKVAVPDYLRERLELSDGDFLDLDWLKNGCRRLVILCHGLEGNSHRTYMCGMVKALAAAGYDCLAWNYRGCSEEPNRLPKLYHSGAIEDLESVVSHSVQAGYDEISLLGFSLGGNLVLRYLGECASAVREQLKRAVAISPPCDLRSSAYQLASRLNRLYMQHFLKSLRAKIEEKAKSFPDLISLAGLQKIKNFIEFDNIYTAPLHGFKDAEDYWKQASSRFVLHAIKIPTLILSALDDPFLTPECYPIDEAASHESLTLETPKHGGHAGFADLDPSGQFYHERRAVEFLGSCAAA